MNLIKTSVEMTAQNFISRKHGGKIRYEMFGDRRVLAPHTKSGQKSLDFPTSATLKHHQIPLNLMRTI
jgi:hypothetical protein